MKDVRALVLTGYGLNCDYETDYALKMGDSAGVMIMEPGCFWPTVLNTISAIKLASS